MLSDGVDKAIREAALDILKGEPWRLVISETAALYRLRPELLQRKFEEAHGPPQTFFDRQSTVVKAARLRNLSDEQLDQWLAFRLKDLDWEEKACPPRAGP